MPPYRGRILCYTGIQRSQSVAYAEVIYFQGRSYGGARGGTAATHFAQRLNHSTIPRYNENLLNQYWGDSPSAQYLMSCNLPNNPPVCSTDSILLIVSQTRCS